MATANKQHDANPSSGGSGPVNTDRPRNAHASATAGSGTTTPRSSSNTTGGSRLLQRVGQWRALHSHR